MTVSVDSFRVTGLHGSKLTYNLKLKDNTVIIVGENGSGKTTILRLLFYILSGQWRALTQYQFKEIAICINGKEHSLPNEILKKKIARIDPRALRNFPPSVRRRIMETLEQTQGQLAVPEIESLCERYGIPPHYLLHQMDLFDTTDKESSELKKLFDNIAQSLKSQILYLPTYRRIEQEFNLIFGVSDDDDDWKRTRHMQNRPKSTAYIELIEFGMQDVKKAIDQTLERLKEFARENLTTLTLGYLGDVVDKKYDDLDPKEIKNTSTDTIESVLCRIDERILSATHKEHLHAKIDAVRKGAPLDEHAKVICHYFLKLLHFQQELRERESQITDFCNVCNKYIVDGAKEFIYDSITFAFKIASKVKGEQGKSIELRHLSSGEKQIVSLFSHLYLSGEKTFFVLIDEPELSLSVPWQRKFLVDVKAGGFCSGLVAVTHSPFIYENELEKYAHGLGEFITMAKGAK